MRYTYAMAARSRDQARKKKKEKRKIIDLFFGAKGLRSPSSAEPSRDNRQQLRWRRWTRLAAAHTAEYTRRGLMYSYCCCARVSSRFRFQRPPSPDTHDAAAAAAAAAAAIAAAIATAAAAASILDDIRGVSRQALVIYTYITYVTDIIYILSSLLFSSQPESILAVVLACATCRHIWALCVQRAALYPLVTLRAPMHASACAPPRLYSARHLCSRYKCIIEITCINMKTNPRECPARSRQFADSICAKYERPVMHINHRASRSFSLCLRARQQRKRRTRILYSAGTVSAGCGARQFTGDSTLCTVSSGAAARAMHNCTFWCEVTVYSSDTYTRARRRRVVYIYTTTSYPHQKFKANLARISLSVKVFHTSTHWISKTYRRSLVQREDVKFGTRAATLQECQYQLKTRTADAHVRRAADTCQFFHKFTSGRANSDVRRRGGVLHVRVKRFVSRKYCHQLYTYTRSAAPNATAIYHCCAPQTCASSRAHIDVRKISYHDVWSAGLCVIYIILRLRRRMAATDGQIIVAAARWADEATYLRDFVAKQRLPAVIKITKGQYGGLGVPTLPAPSLQSTALLVSAGRRRKIVAQAVKIKEGRRVVGVGPRLAIPDSYVGYFEILSEEGRAVRGIESVAELSRRCPEAGALVRETVRGIACKLDENGAAIPEGSRTLAVGETIVVAGELTLPGRGRFLRCIDCRDDNVLLPLEQRARFSVLAREDNISGVHTARGLLCKRLPLTVRLVHGQPPRGLKSSSQFLPELRLLSSFEEEHVFAIPLQREGAAVALPLAAPLKLVKARNEEALRAMPEFARLVDRSSRLVAEVADRCVYFVTFHTSVVPCKSYSPVCVIPMRRYRSHVLDGRLGESKSSRQGRSAGGFLRRSVSSDSANSTPAGAHHRSHHHHHHYHHQHSMPVGHGYRDENRVPQSYSEEYDEIDQIYDYVRGFAPLPKSVRSPYESPLGNGLVSLKIGRLTPRSLKLLRVQKNTENRNAQGNGLASVTVTMTPLDDRPEPPPIETIPTKKAQAEKRTRRSVKEQPQQQQQHHHLHASNHNNSNTTGTTGTTVTSSSMTTRTDKPPLSKLYVKNGGTQRGRPLMRQKSASPLKETPPVLKGGSPLFNIRYKSLTNLQQAMELDGTLDSSHSGGRTSGDSGAGAKLPEKRSRRLSRPRSLTNLVWELRNGGSGGGVGNGCNRSETPPTMAQQVTPMPLTKCGPRLALTVLAPRRVGTLYL
ncbi:unnamed protein product [Trichogramma brassicae]|uniref:CABIT domain-containing protein n=1 Tax=Trichogramma brassicae TaxID=86971 RepID=A0A6H5J1Y8_9HYME|nr:unnamed protein product [Trichogramma brassicae]